MTMSNKHIQIFTTCSKKPEAQRIADSLIKNRLAACVQIVGPIESRYRWKGKNESQKEYLCIIKTQLSLYKKAEKHIKKMHPYELPEITFTKIGGNTNYLDWITKETK